MAEECSNQTQKLTQEVDKMAQSLRGFKTRGERKGPPPAGVGERRGLKQFQGRIAS